ncbi:DEAD/DEAH box helicase [Candidatus Methylospira mobilis]|uniref:DEAD-box ATP-dependent RNA helicase RhpA n=1 Tax=Candidatus Methylospira mobilis TaxID=1808979 RepID=A0A5Q0BKU5_9GAMM|nr:DEAD/DEAH box helicase [Candidatus Methylospira mobilis]QFY42831.1 DEAD/DEAH box helicase [Candidatus Methylospira mobilis]
MPFTQLGLRAEILRAVSEQGYENPTPIQAQAIPLILEGKDLLAGAQTGTGKTAGFTLPLLQRLSETPAANGGPRYIRALVLVPTRELAAQVFESVNTYGKYLPGIRPAVIFGGVGMVPQIDHLRRGVDILVATPGRLLDHVRQRTMDLSRVEFFVLDEADRMLDMGFIHDVRKVMALLPQQRQSLLFSATFSDEIRTLAGQLLKQPSEVSVARRNTTAENVQQCVYPVEKDRKRELLSWLVGSGNWKQVLVFTRTKHGADRLGRQLERDGIETAVLHGNKSQGARTKALDGFKQGKVAVLVATDIAARGIDIDELPHVVNFELPNVPEDYVHRIGRTGRAGASGEAISLVCHEEVKLLAAIEKLIKREITRVTAPGFEATFSFDPRLAPKTPPKTAQVPRPGAKPGYPPPHSSVGQRPGEATQQRPASGDRNHGGNANRPRVNSPRPARGR